MYERFSSYTLLATLGNATPLHSSRSTWCKAVSRCGFICILLMTILLSIFSCLIGHVLIFFVKGLNPLSIITGLVSTPASQVFRATSPACALLFRCQGHDLPCGISSLMGPKNKNHWFSVCLAFSYSKEFEQWHSSSLHIRAETGSLLYLVRWPYDFLHLFYWCGESHWLIFRNWIDFAFLCTHDHDVISFSSIARFNLYFGKGFRFRLLKDIGLSHTILVISLSGFGITVILVS